MKKAVMLFIIAFILFAGGLYLGYDVSKNIINKNNGSNNAATNSTTQKSEAKLTGEQGDEFAKNIYIGIWRYEAKNNNEMYGSSEKGRYYGEKPIKLIMQENNNKVYKYQAKEYEKEESKIELIKELSDNEYKSFVKEIQKTISTDAKEDDYKQTTSQWVIYYSNKRYVVNQDTIQNILKTYFDGVDLNKWE